MTYRTNNKDKEYGLIPPHGGYRNLKSFQMATLVYDLTVQFCELFIDKSYRSNRSYKTYEHFLAEPENAANALICLIHQANFLLDQQIKSLEKDFLEQGGFTERLYQKRREKRGF